MSRLVWQSEDAALYEPDLFLQGLILVIIFIWVYRSLVNISFFKVRLGRNGIIEANVQV